MAQCIKQEMPNMNGTDEPQVYYRLKTNHNIATLELKAFRQDPASCISFVGRGSQNVYVKKAVEE